MFGFMTCSDGQVSPEEIFDAIPSSISQLDHIIHLEFRRHNARNDADEIKTLRGPQLRTKEDIAGELPRCSS